MKNQIYAGLCFSNLNQLHPYGSSGLSSLNLYMPNNRGEPMKSSPKLHQKSIRVEPVSRHNQAWKRTAAGPNAARVSFQTVGPAWFVLPVQPVDAY